MKRKYFLLLAIPVLLLSTGCAQTGPSNPESDFIHMEKEVDVKYEVTEGKRASNSSNKITLTSDANFFVASRAVKEGERYVATFKASTTSYLAFALTNDTDDVISTYDSNKDNYGSTEYVKCCISVPHKATTLYINCVTSYKDDFDLQRLDIKNVKKDSVKNNIDKTTLKIGCNNTGEFDYGTTQFTAAEYKTHWDTMLKEHEYDFFGYEDLAKNQVYTADNTPLSEMLGKYGNEWITIPGLGQFEALSSQYKAINVALVPLPFKANGKSTKRFAASRATFLINNKLTAIYVLHLIAEGHISTTITDKQGNKINYLSQQVRQNQFQALIKDSQVYDEAIFIGDFNAQKASEYSTFVEAGFNICNGSEEYGEIITLVRDPNGADKDKPSVPADNIVMSKGLRPVKGSFSKLEGYNLNTDHRPVFATLEFVED